MTSSSGTRPSLIRQAQARSDVAWEQLVQLYTPLILAWGRKLGATSDQCDDLCQEVFAAASRQIGSFRGDGVHGSFRGWLWKITYRKWIDRYRREKGSVPAIGGSTAALKLEQIEDPQLEDVPEISTPDMVQSLLTRGMRLVQNEFQKEHWEAFWLSTVEGLATDQIAERLGLSTSNVRQIRSRVLRRLRDVLGDF